MIDVLLDGISEGLGRVGDFLYDTGDRLHQWANAIDWRHAIEREVSDFVSPHQDHVHASLVAETSQFSEAMANAGDELRKLLPTPRRIINAGWWAISLDGENGAEGEAG